MQCKIHDTDPAGIVKCFYTRLLIYKAIFHKLYCTKLSENKATDNYINFVSDCTQAFQF